MTTKSETQGNAPIAQGQAVARPVGKVALSMIGESKAFAISTISVGIILLWYVMVVVLNSDWQIQIYEREGQTWEFSDLVSDTMAQDRPVIPAPHQVVEEVVKSVFGVSITSKRSLIYHGWITLSSTLLGFGAGAILGVLLAIGIVYIKTLDRALMPWIIASQTVPILAIAPMIIVVLGAIGLKGLVPKAIISAYLCFFPVTVSMVKGLRSPDKIALDLYLSYSASKTQELFKLRLPCSMPFLFTSLKVAIAASLVGAIIGELPTGAVAGLGAKLLAGSYYGQTIQMWAALVMASVMAASLVWLVGKIEVKVLNKMGLNR